MRQLGPHSLAWTPRINLYHSSCNTSVACLPNQANQFKSPRKVSWRIAWATLTHRIRNSQYNSSTLQNLEPQWRRTTPKTLLLSIRSHHPIRPWRNSKLFQRLKQLELIKIRSHNVAMEAPRSSPRTIMIRIRIKTYWQGWEARVMSLQSSATNRQPKAASLVQRQQIASVPILVKIVTRFPPVRRSRATVALLVSQEVLLELEEKAAT